MVILASTILTNSEPLQAQSPSDFADEAVVTGMQISVSADWLPDGRALVLGKLGRIYVVDPSTGAKSNHFTISGVDYSGERGALDIVVDPNFDFASNRHFYVYYSDSTSRLTIARYTFDENGTTTANSRQILWTNPGPLHSQFGPYHIGGSLNIGADGKFYLSVGDGFVAANSNNFTNVFGKILRINLDGSVPSDNPFFDGAGPNIDETWAFGLRNPFRASFDPTTGRYFIGDVGGNYAPTAYEEINLGEAGKNYGWPACEGPLSAPKSGATCPAGVTAPISYYTHDTAGGCCQNASITGGEVFRSNALPGSLWGSYIYGDYAQREIRYLSFNQDGTVAQDAVLKSVPSYQPVWIGQGPDGHVYYIHFNWSGDSAELRRIRYLNGSDSPPVITQASASPVSGPTPLNVTFSGAASDADGDPLDYIWDFGDGATSTSPNIAHNYNLPGIYNARLTATAGGQSTFSTEISIQVGAAPEVTINSPAHQSTFIAGTTIQLSGSATDDGALEPEDYVWDVALVHDNHLHPALTGITGATYDFDIPDSGHDFAGDTSYLVSLTVTDADGTATTETVEIEPQKVDITFAHDPAVVPTVVVDGITQNAPFILNTATGFQHTVEAPLSECIADTFYTWTAWDNGAPRLQTFTAPAASTSIISSYSNGNCPDVIDPSVSWAPPFNTATEANPVDAAAPTLLAGSAADNVGLLNVQVRIDDLGSGLHWNVGTSSWQSSPKWNVVAQPGGAVTTNWSTSFTPVGGVGPYRAFATVKDLAGNIQLPRPITYFTSPPDTTDPGISWDAPLNNSQNSATPVELALPATISGTATDDQSLAFIRLLIRDRGTGDYWNTTTNQWQSGVTWNTTATPPDGTTTQTWTYQFAPPTGTGNYYARILVQDNTGNRLLPPPITYFKEPNTTQ